MSGDMVPLQATKCPCGHKTCRSGNLSPITYAQGVMSLGDAQEIAYRCNAFPVMLLALKNAQEAMQDALNNLPKNGECAQLIRERIAIVNVAITGAGAK